MLFSFFKIVPVLLAIGASTTSTSASAISNGNIFSMQKRQNLGETLTCVLLLKPNTPENPLQFDEFQIDIGQALRQATNGNDTFFYQDDHTANADGTYTINVQLSTSHQTAAQTISIINSWVGNTLFGILRNWLVERASCVPGASAVGL